MVAEGTSKEGDEAPSLFGRLRTGLAKTRARIGDDLANLLLGGKVVDEVALEELETALLLADAGVDTTQGIISRLTDRVKRRELANVDALFQALAAELTDILAKHARGFDVDSDKRPFVVLVVGVNGAGKTTSIGKLAHLLKQEGKSVLLAAGDTFRAAAVEQLQIWGERNDVPVVAQHGSADSASVIFDAIESARARDIDVVIADTAGRLQNKANLMEELKKVCRVMAKLDPDAPHEVLLVLDAGTGQNALVQARDFKDVVGVTGIILTKLDGTAKGGMAFAVAEQTELPIYFIGVGESLLDLRPFDPGEFVQALLAPGD